MLASNSDVMGLSVEQVASVYERRYAGFRLGAAAILNDFEAAHDAVQDGFAQALVDRANCRGSLPEAWIWRIVERKAFAELRRRGKAAPDYDLEPIFSNIRGSGLAFRQPATEPSSRRPLSSRRKRRLTVE